MVLVDRTTRSGVECGQPTILPSGLMGRQLYNLLSASDQLTCPGIAIFCPHLTIHRVSTTPPSSPARGSSSLFPPSPPYLPFSPRRDLSPRLPSLLQSPSVSSSSPGNSTSTDLRPFGVTGQLVRVRAILGPLATDEVFISGLPRFSAL